MYLLLLALVGLAAFAALAMRRAPLWQWAAEHQDDVKQARIEYDARHPDAEPRPPERRYAGAVG